MDVDIHVHIETEKTRSSPVLEHIRSIVRKERVLRNLHGWKVGPVHDGRFQEPRAPLKDHCGPPQQNPIGIVDRSFRHNHEVNSSIS